MPSNFRGSPGCGGRRAQVAGEHGRGPGVCAGAPYSLQVQRFTVYSLHATVCIYSLQYTVYFAWGLQFTAYNLQGTSVPIGSAMYFVALHTSQLKFTMHHSLQFTVYSLQFTVYIDT